MTRDSIVFYKSFYDSAQILGDKSRLRFYDTFFKISFSEYESVSELEQKWNENVTKLEHFRATFAQLSLIKYHILNSAKQYLNGKRGGAPLRNQNAKKQPKNKQIEIENKKENYIKENYIKEKNTPIRFIKPTIEEIKKYCTERNNSVAAEYFYDYYESKDWYIGKNKMKDWKAAVRTWEKNKSKTKQVNKEERVKVWSI